MPQEDQIQALQKQYGFLNDCAQYLLQQNGFSFDGLAKSPDADSCLTPNEDDGQGGSDLRLLFGLGAQASFADLHTQLEEFMLRDFFFPIGAATAATCT